MMIKSKLFNCRLGFAVALCLGGATANAETAFGKETLKARIGGYFSDFDTNINLSGPNNDSSVNLEDALGLDTSQTVVRGDLVWRIAPKHRIQLGFVDFQRDAVGEAERSFTVETKNGTYEFDAGARLKTEFDWRLIPLTYAYSFYKTDDLEVAGAIGVHWFDMDIGLTGDATLTPPGGTPTPVSSTATGGAASGPLPVLGLSADYALSERWIIGAHAGWFGLDYDDISGELIDLGLVTEYWFSDHFGAGLGYSYYAVDITKSRGNFEVGADYTYQGAEAYLTARF